jgi:hypothetical protein
MTTKELVENFRFKEKTTRRDSRGSGVTKIINNMKFKYKLEIISIFFIIGLFFFLIFYFYMNEGIKSYYCLSNGNCITVWKKTSKEVYIIYGKYNSTKKPSDDYVKLIDITNEVDMYASVIFTKDDKLLIDVIDDSTKVISQSSKGIIELYNNKKTLNDSLYTYFDGKYRKYKKEVEFLNISYKENYARDKNGNIYR